MAFWNSLKEQLLALWKRWTLGQRVGFSAAAIACVSAVVGTMIWASQPDYVVIASQLTPSRAADFAGVLDTEKISYKLNYSSSAVSVASGDVSRARIALKDVLSPEEATSSGMDSLPMFATPASEQDRRRAAMEKSIEKSITQIRGIRTAKVQISRPDQTPFAVEQSPVTASVVIGASAGEQINSSTGQTIIALVASSVPGLKADNILLTDTNGRQFGSKQGIENSLEMQIEYRQRLEAHLAHSAETLLASAEGVRAKVSVTAEVDFSAQTQTVYTYDPETKVKVKESIINNKQDAGMEPPVGLAGTATNIQAAANTTQVTSGNSTNEQIETEYENSYRTEEIANIPGKITRISVAAIVDIRPTAPADPNATQTPALPLLQQQQIEDIIKSAVGFDSLRNDEVQVILAPLAPEIADAPIPTGFVWEQWQPLLQSVSLGLAASLAFLIGMMLIKRMKPIVITETVGPGIPLADARRLASISEQAKANPEIVANILSAWLNEQEQSGSGPQPSPAAETIKPSRLSSSASDTVLRSATSQVTSMNEGRKAA